MSKKKEGKIKEKAVETEPTVDAKPLVSKEDLHSFLVSIKDRMADDSAPPVYVLSALNHTLSLPNIYDMLDNPNKELAKDIWSRLKKVGLVLKDPPLLFA